MVRIGLNNTGDFLILPDAAVLSIQVISTLFNSQDDFVGSIQFPGTADLEPNQAMLQNANLITTDPALRSLPARVWLGQYPFAGARFVYTIEGPTINFVLYIDASLVVNQLKTLYLDQLSGDGIDDQIAFATVADYKAYMLATTTATPGTYPMIFYPVKNDGMYKTIDPANYGDYPDIHFPVSNYFNAWTNTTGTGSFVVDAAADPVGNTQVPFFTLPYVLKRVVKFLGYRPIGKWLDQEASNRITICSMVANVGYEVIPNYYNFMDHELVSDFIKRVRTEQELAIVFNELDKTCLIDSLVNLEATDDVFDLRDIQTTGYRETGTTADAYIVTQTPDDKDAAFSDEDKALLPQLIIGNPATANQVTDIEMQSACTRMLTEITPANTSAASWRIPYVKQPIYGTTPLSNIAGVDYADRNSFKMRFLYYHGMMPDDAGYLYPYASADNIDKDGNALTGYSLAIGSAHATYIPIKHYYQFLKNSKPFELDCELSAQQMLQVKPDKRYLVRDFNGATVSCLFDQMGGDFGAKELTPAKFTLYPRILIANTAEVDPVIIPGPPGPPIDNGTVYAKIDLRNRTPFSQTIPAPASGNNIDVYVEFFLDAAATTPKDVTGLDLRYKITRITSGGSTSTIVTNISLSVTSASHESELLHQALEDEITGGLFINCSYDLMPSAYYTII